MKIRVHLKEKFHFNPVHDMTSMANIKINKIFPLYSSNWISKNWISIWLWEVIYITDVKTLVSAGS